jgi:squalene synthase HpnC
MHTSVKTAIKLPQAYQHCLAIAQQHYENFPTASKLLRRDLRPAVAAIYAFARHADDLADEGDAEAETRLKQIDAWETLLERSESDEQIDHPIFLALGDSIRTYQLPIEALHNLLIAFRMDVSLHVYASLDELMFYCKHSANPIGHLMLALHGINEPQALFYSDKICTALQLINFWQDLSIDLPKGRCYLPETWLQEAGLSSQQLLQENMDSSEPVISALQQAVSTTRELLQQGSALLPMLPFRLRLQIAATLRAGHLILNKITRLEQPLTERVVVNKGEWKKLAFPALMDAMFPSRLASQQYSST